MGGMRRESGAAELLSGDARLVEGLGFDEVAHGFGLGEIEAAGEEGALGKFAGLGEAGAGGDGLAERGASRTTGEPWAAISTMSSPV